MLYVTDEQKSMRQAFDITESAVILRKRSPSLREGLPTKDLCIAGRL
jgi:hypothetical protein